MAANGLTQEIHFAQVIRAPEALTQWRALFACIITCVVFAVVAALGGSLAMKAGFDGAKFIIAATVIVAFVVLAVGLSAVGVLLMDRAKQIEPRSLVDAFVYCLLCLPKFIGFALMLLVLALLVGGLAYVVYFVCKAPGIGPVLLFVAHPLLVVAAAALLAAVIWIGVPLFAPAVWDGLGFMEALSVLLAVARQRLVQVVVMYLLLYVVLAVVSFLVGSALVPSFISMSAIATAQLGPDVSRPDSLMQMMMTLYMSIGGGASGGSSGQFVAFLLASAVIFGVAAALLGQVFVMGINLIYLVAVDGLDVAASQSAIEGRLAQVKEKAREAQARAQQAAERARAQRGPAGAAAPAAMGGAAGMACPQCKAPVTASDPFCSECGYRLKA